MEKEKTMEPKVWEALTGAAMLPAAEQDTLGQDLLKIQAMAEAAAASAERTGKTAETDVCIRRFQHRMGMEAQAETNTIALRADEPVLVETEENLAAQSGRYEEPYTVVPRVV